MSKKYWYVNEISVKYLYLIFIYVKINKIDIYYINSIQPAKRKAIKGILKVIFTVIYLKILYTVRIKADFYFKINFNTKSFSLYIAKLKVFIFFSI